MAHTKAGGSTRLGRDSRPKGLGVKKFGGEQVKPGNIIARQRGTHWNVGKNVRKGSDDSIYAVTNGFVKFTNKIKTCFDGKKKRISVINVVEKKEEI